MKKLLVAALAVLGLVAISPAAAKVERTQAGPERFLVGFDRTPGAAERATVARGGGQVLREIPEANALAVRMPAAAAESLTRNPNVVYVEEDALRYPLGLASSQLAPSMSNGLYGLLTTRSTNAHSRGWTGQGIKACVADTGLDYNHPDIAPRYAGGIDTIDNDFDPTWNSVAGDPESHGTHVAGTVLAANDTQGVFGVAYNATLYHARVLKNTGGYSSDIMDGVRWLVKTAGCKVVNMSLGGGFKSRTEENFYKEMRAAGSLIVAASGNDSSTKVSFPAGYAVNIAVGAVDRNNTRASFSNTGRNLDVAAPGVTVLSAVPSNHGSEASVSTTSTFTAYGMEFAGKTSGTTGTLVDCGKALAATDCGVRLPGFVALILRGDISFADKVKNAMDAGAAAAIIYNNAPEEFTGTLGAATTSDGRSWIPAVTTSGNDGAALKSGVGTSATVTNIVSSWDHYDGTSMATPHAAGVVALIWSVNPGLSNSAVEDHLFKTAKDLGAVGYDTTYGYGLVNAEAATIRAGG